MPFVSRSCELFPDGFYLHLLPSPAQRLSILNPMSLRSRVSQILATPPHKTHTNGSQIVLAKRAPLAARRRSPAFIQRVSDIDQVQIMRPVMLQQRWSNRDFSPCWNMGWTQFKQKPAKLVLYPRRISCSIGIQIKCRGYGTPWRKADIHPDD